MKRPERSRYHGSLRAGRVERREFEYVRHGTASLIAALAGDTRNDSAHFIEFMEQIETSIDPDLAIHVVLDNGSSYRSKATKKWLAEHHGSWFTTPRSARHG